MAGEVSHHSPLACEDDEHRCFASPEVAPNQFNFHCASLESEHEELPERGSAGRLGQQQSWLKRGKVGIAFHLKGCVGVLGQAVCVLLMFWMLF